MPLVIDHFLTAKKTDRMIPARGPERVAGSRSETFNHVRVRRFLKDHEVRRRGFNHLRQRLLTAHSAESNVVTE